MHYKLPCKIFPLDYKLIPKDWDNITEQENTSIETLKLSEQTVYTSEQETVTQSSCSAWYELRKNRLASSKAHLVYKRQRNHESLANDLLNPKQEASLPSTVREALNYGKLNEPKGRKCYTDYLKFSLKHEIDVGESGIVIQPNLYWLAASTDGLVSYKCESNKLGLVKIKCLKSKQFMSPEEFLKDENFDMCSLNGFPEPKKDHSHRYYTQIQMAMGLCGLSFCDFVV